jgi:surfeit locus 1 family protein
LSALLTRLQRAGLIWPALFTLVGLAVLIGLGTWQMSRKVWKEELQSQIAARARAEPVTLAEALQRWNATGDVEYLRVRMSGRFRHVEERHVFAIDEKLGPGYHIYTPLETLSGRLVLVNRGFVPAGLKEAASRAAGQVNGAVTITGLVRRPMAQGWFTPASEPERNMFYWPDYATMLGSAGEAGKGGPSPVPFFVDAEASPENPGGFPKGGVTRLALSNRHLEYALTWYGLALTLIGVFAAFAVGRLRPAA